MCHGADRLLFAASRVGEGYAAGVEMKALWRWFVGILKCGTLPSVKHIAKNRAAQAEVVCRVYAELMCTSCHWVECNIYSSVRILSKYRV